MFFPNNNVYETVSLNHWDTEIVPLMVPYYRQSNNTVLVPFFSDMLHKFIDCCTHAQFKYVSDGEFYSGVELTS